MNVQQIVSQRRGKALLKLPLLVIPFMTLLFWALDGGKGVAKPQTAQQHKGMNTNLPDARFAEGTDTADKLSIYEMAAKTITDTSQADALYTHLGFNSPSDQKEKEINQKLEQLNQIVSAPAPTYSGGNANMPGYYAPRAEQGSEVRRLEKLMKSMQASGEEDPEMKQLNSMLEKIQEIQQPELARAKYKSGQPKENVSRFSAIPVTIAENQKVTEGSVLKLVLSDTLRINGQMIHKGQPLFGRCHMENQRVLLDVKSIRMGNAIIPVELTVYDLDGLEGIDAPEALVKDAVRNGSDDAIQSLHLLTMDQGIGAQAAGAGISAAKGLFGKKVKCLKEKLKAGRKLLLRNRQTQYQ